MSSQCYTLWKIPRVRATLLNSCGVPVTGCSTVVSDGIISLEMTKEYEPRDESGFVKNGDGLFCVTETTAPILKWINITATFCNVDPELVNIMSAEPLVMNDASSPVAVGYSTQEGAAANANFALEAWSRIANNGSVPCTGGPSYGYTLLPWIVEGTVSDLTLDTAAANFVLTGRTRNQSQWGTGPYNVRYLDNPAGSTTPGPLLTPILSTQHMRQFLTRMPPPTAACGCTTLSDLTP